MLLEKNNLNGLYSEVDVERRFLTIKRQKDARDGFERDHGRIIHSAAFRRLQAKTQVIGTEEGDYHRTRLTHSMEVAQIARGIVNHLNQMSETLRDIGKLDTSLIEVAALAHDFGHPPFGHQGERALNKCMIDYGGFEGNAHTFRLLTRLEGKVGEGLNLTRATLLSVLKYPITFSEANKTYGSNDNKPPKISVFDDDYDALCWLLHEFSEEEKLFLTEKEKKEKDGSVFYKSKNKTLECSIIELADDIAYATHDLEDAIKLNLINFFEDIKPILSKFDQDDRFSSVMKEITNIEANGKSRQNIKELFSSLISMFIVNVEIEERRIEGISSPRLKFYAHLPSDLNSLMEDLKRLEHENVIMSHRIQTIEWKGGYIVEKLFNAIFDNDNLLPNDERNLINGKLGIERARVVCDYIAGMTDSYALKMYSRLFGSRNGRLFEI